MNRFSIYFLVLALLSSFALAQDNLDDSLFGSGGTNQESSEDDIFGASDNLFGYSFFSEVEDDPNANPAEDLLTNEGVSVGGEYSILAELDWDLNAEEDDQDNEAFSSGLKDMNTQIYLDARPNSDFRAFAKGDVSYDTDDGVDFELREAFADVDINDSVFIRAGKQTINWGVGSFFSPANLINLEEIDPENVDAELTGPVAIKAQVPMDINNFTGYALLDDKDNGNGIGLATRYEFLVGGFEYTAGGVWRQDDPWAVMATTTGSVDGIYLLEDITLFGEVVLEGNTGKTFIVEDKQNPLGYSAALSEDMYLSATVGGRANYKSEDELFSVAGSLQYLFNGAGYEDTSIFTENQQVVGALLGQGDLSFTDLGERGQHYAAASLSFPDINKSGFTPSTFWLSNLSDGSGFVTTNLSYIDIDNITPSLSYRYNYGEEGSEYSPLGDSHSITLSVNIGGSF